MSNPALCFANYIEFYDADDKIPASFSATTEATGYPIENVSNWRLDGESRWKANTTAYQFIYADFGAGVTVQPDTCIIAGHNTSKNSADSEHGLYYSDDAAAWTAAASGLQPVDDRPLMTTFTEDAHRYWALDFQATSATPVELAHWYLGQRLDFPTGIQPGLDYHSGTPAFYNDSPLHGSPLGRAVSHINKSIRVDWPAPGFDAQTAGALGFFNYASTPDYDDVFMRHFRDGTPFWFSPDNGNDPTRIYFGWTDGFSTPFVGSLKRRSFSGTITSFEEVF